MMAPNYMQVARPRAGARRTGGAVAARLRRRPLPRWRPDLDALERLVTPTHPADPDLQPEQPDRARG